MSNLYTISVNGTPEELKAYLELHPQKIDHPQYNGKTAIYLAAEAGRDDQIEVLVANGSQGLDQFCILTDTDFDYDYTGAISPFYYIYDKATPLHAAVRNGHLSTVKTICKFSQEHINTATYHRHVPIEFAVGDGQMEIIAYLSSCSNFQPPPGLYHLALNGDRPLETFFHLLKLGIPLRNTLHPQTLLELIIGNDDLVPESDSLSLKMDRLFGDPKILPRRRLELIRILYQSDPNNFVSVGSEVLHQAARYGNRAELELVYQLGYRDLHHRTSGGYPLDAAIDGRCKTNIRVLRALGVDPNLRRYEFLEWDINSWLSSPLSEEFILEVRFNAIFARSLTQLLLDL